jgi:preprotein translocase subunit SecG
MENLILAVHYSVCAFLIVVILLQAGKGADIGAVFGGGSGTVFGSRGATTFLSKLTTAMAVVFLLTSISLASISRSKSESSILKTVPQNQPGPVPAAPVETAPQEGIPGGTETQSSPQ